MRRTYPKEMASYLAMTRWRREPRIKNQESLIIAHSIIHSLAFTHSLIQNSLIHYSQFNHWLSHPHICISAHQINSLIGFPSITKLALKGTAKPHKFAGSLLHFPRLVQVFLSFMLTGVCLIRQKTSCPVMII